MGGEVDWETNNVKSNIKFSQIFDCELRSITVLLRMTLLLLLGISISQNMINNRPFRGWINAKEIYPCD